MPVVIWSEGGTRRVREFPHTEVGYEAARAFALSVQGQVVDDSTGIGMIEAGLRAGPQPVPIPLPERPSRGRIRRRRP